MTCAIIGWPAQCSISFTAPTGSSIATLIEPRQRSCQLFLLSSQWLSSQWLIAIAFECASSGSDPRGAERLEDDEVAAGLHDHVPEREVRVGAREVAVLRERVEAHRLRAVVVRRVVRVRLPHPATRPVLAPVRLRDVLRELPRARRRMQVAVDDPYVDAGLGRSPFVNGYCHVSASSRSKVNSRSPRLRRGRDRRACRRSSTGSSRAALPSSWARGRLPRSCSSADSSTRT